MNKMYKKVVSIALVVLMCLTMAPLQGIVGLDISNWFASEAKATGGHDFSAAEELAAKYHNAADYFNFEEYLSNHFRTSPTIDLINIGMDEDLSITTGFVSDLENNWLFQEAYDIWEVSTFIGNPGETVEKILNRELYYETVLFRLLNSSINSDSAMDWLNQGAVNHSIKFAQILADSAEWDYSYDVSRRTNLSDLSDEELDYLNSLANNYVSGQAYTMVGNVAGFVDTALNVSSSIEEFSGRIGSYLQLSNLSESTIEFLKILKSNTSNKLLSKALDTIIAVSSESFIDFMKEAANAGAVSLGKAALKSFIGNKWKSLLTSKLTSGILSSGYTVVNGVLIANSLGQLINDVCFSTSKKLDHYELMKALKETETVIKNTVLSMLAGSTSGTMLFTAIDVLYDMYELDCDLCTDLVNIMDKDWMPFSTTAQRNQAKENINTVKTFYATQYERIMPKKGSCGKELYWLFDNVSGQLIIYGLGEMNDYTKGTAPWYEYKDSIRSLHVTSLCTQVGTYAFYNLSNIKQPIILTSFSKYAVSYEEGCFDAINEDAMIIFTEYAELVDTNNFGNTVVYALDDIYCDGPAYFKEIYVQGDLCSSNIISIADSGFLVAKTFSSTNITTDRGVHLYLNKNATAEIYGDALFLGREHDPFVEVDFDALTILSGGKLNIYGNVRFCSGVYDVNYGAQVNIIGDCLIGDGGICEPTYFYCYGDMYVGNQLDVEGGYCADTYMVIYGTVTMGDYTGGFGPGDGFGLTYLRGDAFITDSTVQHHLSYIVMDDSDAYLSVHGPAYYINGYDPCIGTIDLFGDAYFSDPGNSELTVIFNGDEKQTIKGYKNSVTAGQFIINNKNGVVFETEVTSLVLFNHKQNPFTLKNSKNTFQDYDNDGLLDNIDPYPLDPLNVQNNTDFSIETIGSKLYITQYNGDSKNVIIPNAIGGHNVYGIKSIDNNSVETLYFGDNVEIVNSDAFDNLTNLKEISVSEKNTHFSSENGVLYNKNKSTLIRCPVGYENDVLVPVNVNSISEGAFKLTDVDIVNCRDTVDFNLYHITSPNDLYLLSMLTTGGYSFNNKVVKLDCNINLNATKWVPIGKNATYPFSGVFDGNNHTISGFNYVTTNNDFSGLFGYIKTGGVKNLTVEGLVSGNDRVGMIAGYIVDSALYNCKAVGDVKRTGSGSYGYVGGLVGTALHSVIINCAAETDITAQFGSSGYYAIVGGVAGVANTANSEPMCVLNSYCTGDITVSGDADNYYVGGIVGYLSDDAVNNYYYGRITDESEISTKKIGYAFGYVVPEFTSETDYNGIGKIIVSDNYYPEGETAIGSISVDGFGETEWIEGISEEDFLMQGGENALVEKLNDNKTTVEEIIVAHRDILSGSTWAELVKRIEGDSFTVSNWSIGPDILPVNYECGCTAHIESDWVIDEEATCQKEGSKHIYCLICGETVSTEVIGTIEHTGGTADCKDKSVCSVCGESYGKVDADNHKKTVVDKAVASTCKNTGFTEGSHCESCGKIIVEQTVTDKLAHTEKIISAVEATCTSTGLTEGKKCSVCGEILVKQAETDKLPHNYDSAVTAPTCTAQGFTTYTCECGDSYIGDYISETGHSDNNNDGICDGCGIKLENNDNTDNCSCNCHKSGISGLIWKILRFFYKLFGMNKTCSCGVAHY